MRAAVNKVFLDLAGKSILEWSLSLFERASQVTAVVVVAQPGDIGTCQALRTRYPKLLGVVPCGVLRHRSEFAGVAALSGPIDSGEVDAILVHDAARPFATTGLVDRLLDGVAGVEGCVPGLPVPPHTVVAQAGFIAAYPAGLWSVQTPQVADATWLLEAHNKAARAAFAGTDTASVIEWAGGQVRVIEGESDNIKITTPDDLGPAREIAGRRYTSTTENGLDKKG